MKRNVPTQQVQVQRTMSHARQEISVRPLPAPEELQQYELVKPGFAERLLAMAEKRTRQTIDSSR